MIFLSKEGEDDFINLFARGCNTTPISTDDFVYESSTDSIVLRGILKHKIMKRCWKDNRTFYYMDTGYFGNERSSANPNGWKHWHRIVKNDLQHSEIVARSDDRFKKFNKKFTPWKTNGSKILVAAPDEKPCKFYGVDKDEWIKQTVETIKKYTDRPVEVRQRAPKRIDRTARVKFEMLLYNNKSVNISANRLGKPDSRLFNNAKPDSTPRNIESRNLKVCVFWTQKTKSPRSKHGKIVRMGNA